MIPTAPVLLIVLLSGVVFGLGHIGLFGFVDSCVLGLGVWGGLRAEGLRFRASSNLSNCRVCTLLKFLSAEWSFSSARAQERLGRPAGLRQIPNSLLRIVPKTLWPLNVEQLQGMGN